MPNEITPTQDAGQEQSAIVVVESTDLTMERAPNAVLDEARTAAKALTDVIAKKKKPVIMNGEQYLEFEDWQTIARFYNITAKVESTQLIEIADVTGYEAVAVAIHTASGREISRAESMCLNDERNWKAKPLFQLRSMAQTRACAKALRNVLAWVVVLAGYKPTPAEEMPQEHKANGAGNGDAKATEKQRNLMWAKMTARADATGALVNDMAVAVRTYLGVESSKDIPMSRVDDVLAFIETWEPGPIGETNAF